MGQRKKIILMGGIALLAVLGAFLALPKEPEPLAAPEGVIYYQGPMKAKGGNTYADATGKGFSKAESLRAASEFQRAYEARRK